MDTAKDAVLVIGDWVIDEYWFLVQHHSDISSHTGFSHYRVSNKPDKFVRDLCGAGNIAQALYSINGKKYSLYGLGIWEDNDSKIIGHLIHNKDVKDCKASKVSSGLQIVDCKEEPDVHLITLKPSGPTTRVIRTYHQEGSGYEQLNRIDWDPENETNTIDFEKITSLPKKAGLKGIIVYDLKKGAVTPELVEYLLKEYPDTKWYVRTKDKDVSWLKSIMNLEVLFFGPEVTSILNPWETWLVNGMAKYLALHTLEKMPGNIRVIASNKREILIKSVDGSIRISNSLTGKGNVKLGWSSTVFSVLVNELILDEKLDDISELIKKCIGEADKKDVDMNPNSDSNENEKQIVVKEPINKQFEKEREYWKKSRDIGELGCISEKQNNYLDVWRGATLLPGYISCIKEKDEILCRIGSQLNSFQKKNNNSRPLSILLQADPGSGKTHLAKTLAKMFKFSFLRFDITQMIHKDEILDLFDSIATRQANIRTRIFVFVDEINALLENQNVYSSFLAPLEEGFYSRRGRQFILKPCVWFFAGTKIKDTSTSDKFSDFQSRMTLTEKIDYESLIAPYKENSIDDVHRIEKNAKLEQVYLGAIMVKRFFPDVNEISFDVLDQFSKLSPKDQPARKIRRMAETIRNVQHGKITKKNCDYWQTAEQDWSDRQHMVKLKF